MGSLLSPVVVPGRCIDATACRGCVSRSASSHQRSMKGLAIGGGAGSMCCARAPEWALGGGGWVGAVGVVGDEAGPEPPEVAAPGAGRV